MAKIIHVSFCRTRLPRSLLRDGWWLESKPARNAVLPFARLPPAPDMHRPTEPKPKASHLTLVHSRK
jgi:hypothetical protein